MIVTRRRRKPFRWKRVAVPAVVAVLIAAVFVWTPSRNWVANQPALRPVERPFNVAGQLQTISSQNAQIAALQKQLSDARGAIADRDKQIGDLQTQLNSAQEEAATAKAAKVGRSAPAPAAQSAGETMVGQSDLASQATPDLRRTASVWAAMDPDAAAKVVQRLPDDYVARIFAIMPPDAVGAILETLPAPYAARLTEDHPELSH